MQREFQVGDRVRLTRTPVYWGPRAGKTGTVVYVKDDSGSDNLVEFDDLFRGGHDGNGIVFEATCRDGHGWWVDSKHLELIEPEYAYSYTITAIGPGETKPSSATGIMGRVKTLARKLLDKDTQSLIEAGVLTNDLSVRDTDFVLSFLVNQYKKELAIEARAKIKAERDEDED